MNRFDLEDKIHAINNIVEEIGLISRQILCGKMTREEAYDALNCIVVIHDARHKELWNSFIQTFKLDEYADLHDDTDIENTYSWY